MVDFLNRNAPFFGLFSGEVSSRVSFPLAALTLLQVLFTVPPDENDWPSEQTLTLNYYLIQSTFLFTLVSSLELNNSVP